MAWMTRDAHGTTLAAPVEGRENYGVSVTIANSLYSARAKAQEREALKKGVDGDRSEGEEV